MHLIVKIITSIIKKENNEYMVLRGKRTDDKRFCKNMLLQKNICLVF